jgi:hypothetical protein
MRDERVVIVNALAWNVALSDSPNPAPYLHDQFYPYTLKTRRTSTPRSAGASPFSGDAYQHQLCGWARWGF